VECVGGVDLAGFAVAFDVCVALVEGLATELGVFDVRFAFVFVDKMGLICPCPDE
jgi:hypothetical protein